MPKNTPPKKEARKIPKNFRMFAEDVRRLKLGAEKMGIPAAIYLQFALREFRQGWHRIIQLSESWRTKA
jgi:hypothetical protein